MADKAFDRCTFIIRQFQPTDTPQVHALMSEGLVHGGESTNDSTGTSFNLKANVSRLTL
jgi:hypothetical protein